MFEVGQVNILFLVQKLLQIFQKEAKTLMAKVVYPTGINKDRKREKYQNKLISSLNSVPIDRPIPLKLI